MRRYDAATSGEQRPTIYLFKIACIVYINVPPAIRAPLRNESNILETISQWRRATSLHFILAYKYKRYNKGAGGQHKSLVLRGAIRRPYRLAFCPPTPLSDEDDNGAQADHLIGHGDAVWTAIGDDSHHPDGGGGAIAWCEVARESLRGLGCVCSD